MKSARFPFPGMPRGWFAVALSSEVPAQGVVALRYFARELIAYRGESGRVYVTDAYCPHLGAHLAHGGVVEGDAIRCPFHGWRFEDGRCVGVPYAEKIPPKARLASWPVREQNGVVHVFHGDTPWDLPALDEDGWTEGKAIFWPGLKTHPQEIFENTVDMAHIGPVHAGRGAALIGKPAKNGERFTVELEFQAPGDVVGMPGTLNDVHLAVTMRGLGWSLVETNVRNAGVRARQRIYATPVDEDTVDIRGIVHVKKSDDAEFTAELERIFYDAYVEDFAKDFPIWENKRYLERPMLAKGDGPIPLYRRWCEQFYPRATEARPRRLDLPSRLREGLGEGLATITRLVRASPSAPSRERERETTKRSIASVEEYFATLDQRFVPAAADGVDAVFQWELAGEGGGVFHARVKDRQLEVGRGARGDASVCLAMSADDYVRIVNGELDGVAAFASGRSKLKGSLPLAMKMRALFPA